LQIAVEELHLGSRSAFTLCILPCFCRLRPNGLVIMVLIDYALAIDVSKARTCEAMSPVDSGVSGFCGSCVTASRAHIFSPRTTRTTAIRPTMPTRWAGANESDCHAAVQRRRARRKWRQPRNPMSCCGRRCRSIPPRSVNALLRLLCLLVAIGQEGHCQSSPARHGLRSRQQDPHSSSAHESSSALPFVDVVYSSHDEDLVATSLGGRRRELVTTIRYTNSTLPRKSAVAIYRSFCPGFVWKKGGCTTAQKSVKGGGGAIAATTSSSTSSSSLRWSQCGYTHVLQRYDVAIGQQQTTFRYSASRNGISYSRKLVIVCPHSTKMYVGCSERSRILFASFASSAVCVLTRESCLEHQHPQLHSIKLVVRRVGATAQASHVQAREAATHAHAVPDAGTDPHVENVQFVPHPANLDVCL
jgi:hypothetical protein